MSPRAAGPPDPMDTGKKPLFANLESALRSAYTGPLGDGFGGPEDGEAPAADGPVPEAIGRYRIRGVIARGGMGAVLRAEDPELGRDVALKVSRSRDPALLALFANEARICSQLQHPGIVPVYERGDTDDGRPYYVMKLIEGETLSTLLGAGSTPSNPARLLEIFMAVCQTMAYVHARGFFHGDLKPANIMVGAFGEVQVMDWGIAGGGPEAGSAGEPASAPVAVGTPAYMPPERARASRDVVGIRSDVFSLGAILCEILTGRPPYDGAHRSDVFRKAATADLGEAMARLSACRADAALVSLTRACLAVRPEDRPVDAEAVAHRVADHVAAVARRARDAELELARAHEKHAAERRARRLTVGLAAALLLGLCAGGVGYLLVLDERRIRQGEASRRVDEAMAEAREAVAAAKLAQPPDPDAWEKADGAASRALALAERSRLEPAELERARGLRSETAALRAARMRQLAFQERLEEIEHHGLEEDRQPDWVDAAYRDAFKEVGIDPAHIDAELRADPRARATLGLTLAQWALSRRSSKDPRAADELLEAAMLVDTDPDRKELVSAFLSGDEAAILRMSRSPERLGASPESMLLLSRFLLHLNRREESIAVLESACARHPADFRVHHDLAAQLGVREKPPYDEIIRLVSVCVAVRPSSGHAWTDLGLAYLADEDAGNALVALRKATSVQPAHARGWIGLASALRTAGETASAEEAALRAVACETDAAKLVRVGGQLWNAGLREAAEAALRKAVEHDPGLGVAKFELGQVELARGFPEKAIVLLRDGLELVPGAAAGWYALGRAFAGVMNTEGACDALEKAIALGDRSAEVASELGRALLLEGSTERAIETFRLADERRAAAQGATDGARSELTADAIRAAAFASPAEVASRAREANGPERLAELARLSTLRGWYATAADLQALAIAGDPAGAALLRHQAARAAALAGRGLGQEAVGDPGRRRALRDQALAWMLDELRALRGEWEESHVEGPRVQRRLRSWKADPGLSPGRLLEGPDLDAVERESWTSFWREVDRLLADTERLILPEGVVLEKTFTAGALGIDGPLAGAQFAPDGETLFLVGGAGSKNAGVYQLAVRRDPGTRAISGFGAPRRLCDAANADGGLSQAGDGTFYWSTWRAHELGQFVPGGTAKRYPLDASGAPPGGGGLAFVPAGEAAGALLLSSYADGGIYRLGLSPPVDGARTPIPGSATVVARLPKGIEGMRFLPGGATGAQLLVCNWDSGSIASLAVDARTGLPAAGEGGAIRPRNLLSGIAGASGLDVDPVTRALLVTTWGSGNRILVFSGFASR